MQKQEYGITSAIKMLYYGTGDDKSMVQPHPLRCITERVMKKRAWYNLNQ